MKKLLVLLTIICLCILSPGTQDVFGQESPYPQKFSPGTYAVMQHPTTGAVRLVDIFAATSPAQAQAEHQVPVAVMPGVLHATGFAGLAYDTRHKQLLLVGRSAKGVVLWRREISQKDPEQIGDISIPPGHLLTKMAASPDGEIYALTTPVRGASGNPPQRCRLVKIIPGTPGQKASIRTVAELSGQAGFHAALMYSGDMAFSAAGDLYIFGSAIDTTIRYYTGSAVFRIPAVSLRTGSRGAIRVERLGPIQGMGTVPGYDSTVISGAAFLPDGRFLLSTMDKATQQHVSLFVGRFSAGRISVEPLPIGYEALPPGFLITDLASRHFPVLPPIRTAQHMPVVRQEPVTQPEDWQQYVTIRTYQY
jgi:hypothetical protein